MMQRTYWIRIWKIQHHKEIANRLYLQLFVGGFMSYLRYLCLFA
jgi:cell division protein FtsB